MLQGLNAAISPWAAASPFGVEVGHHLGPEAIELLARAGARWVQTHPALWAAVEGKPGTYQFAPETERFAEACRDADIELVGVLDPRNLPHTSGEYGTAALSDFGQLQAYDQYVRAVVRYYGLWVKHWQVWSASNDGRSVGPHLFPDAYVELLRASYQAAKSADPGCTIVCPVLGSDRSFLERVLSRGGAQWTDVVSVRLPTPSTDPDEVRGYFRALLGLRELLSAQGRALPLWLAVEKVPGPGGVIGYHAEDIMAGALVRASVLGFAASATRLFWPCLLTLDAPNAQNPESGEHSCLAAYRMMTRLLHGAECTGLVNTPDRIWAVRFRKAHRDIVVCWAEKGVVEVILLGTDVSRWDLFGKGGRPADGPLRVMLGLSPLFLSGHSLALA